MGDKYFYHGAVHPRPIEVCLSSGMPLEPIPYLGFRFLILALIVLINGFFAASEVSLLSVRESRLRQLAEQGQAGARVALNLLSNSERLLSVTQVGVTLASLGLGWAGEDTMSSLILHAFGPVIGMVPMSVLHAASFVIGFLLITYFHVIFGEVVPKNISIEKADQLATVLAPALLVFYRVSVPFVIVIEKSAAVITRILGFHSHHRGGGHSAEELKLIVSSIRGSGHLPEIQEGMIHRVLDLEELRVREIMTPRNQIISVSDQSSMDQVLRVMTSQQHSRLPVYRETPEQIIGILHYKDLLALWEERRMTTRAGRSPRPFRIQNLLRKHRIVPETKPVLQMLDEFRTGQNHMALVVDEFGTVTGLLTVEDVLEQIVGEIADEFDETTLHPPAGAEEIEIDGATSIRDLENHYGITLPDDTGFETAAGFMLWKLGHIPAAGEKVEHEGRRFTIIATERNRIAKIRIEKIEAPPDAPAPA
jgi:CBS domain containing-hemolysin-like protein